MKYFQGREKKTEIVKIHNSAAHYWNKLLVFNAEYFGLLDPKINSWKVLRIDAIDQYADLRLKQYAAFQ